MRGSSLIDDKELVERAERGEAEALNELVIRHYSTVVAVAMAILRDYHSAHDCAQEAFGEVIKTLSRLRDRARFGAWICHICKYKAIHMLCRQRLYSEVLVARRNDNRCEVRADSLPHPATDEERLASIKRALAEIPEIYREVLMLKYVDHRSHEDIATLLQISMAAVDKRLTRGKEMLRESLQRWKP